MNRNSKKIVLVLLFFITGSLIISNVFLFNPLTFKRDRITHRPYTYYKKPITYVLVTAGGAKELKNMSTDAIFVYSELKRCEILGSISDENLRKQLKLVNQEGLIQIITWSNLNLSKIRWYGKDSDVCSISGQFDTTSEVWVKMTPKLKENLNEIFTGN